MEAHGSPRGINSWKMQLMDTIMESSISTDSGNFHVFPWKLPLTSMEVNLLQPNFMEASMETTILSTASMEGSMEVSGNFHGRRSKKGNNVACTRRMCFSSML